VESRKLGAAFRSEGRLEAMGHPGQVLELFGPCCSSFAITFLDVPSASNPIMTSRVLAVLLRQSLMEAKFGFQWSHDFSVMEGMCIGRRPATSLQVHPRWLHPFVWPIRGRNPDNQEFLFRYE
jgi:hypothetical protein